MQPLSNIIAGGLLLAALLAAPGAAAQCTGDDIAKAVNDAGAALRKLSADNTPRLQAKMRELKAKKKWPEAGYQERAYQELADERMAALDANANTLLARIDALGTLEPGAAPECGRLEQLQAASLELQATVKTKAAYLLTRIDQMLSDAPVPTLSKAKPAATKAEVKPDAPKAKPPPARTEVKPDSKADSKVAATDLPPAPKPPAASGWSTKTTDSPPDVAVTEPPPAPLPPSSEAEGYTIEEIKAASAGFFGQVSANLAGVIEYLFSKSGRPSGYILGTEGGGAFIAGVRYGNGTLYMRSGGSQKIYWHGPSLGVDVGGAGSKTLFLIYKLHAPEELYSSFTGLDGSAYLVGGVGVTLVTNGTVVLAPIRSGVGLRLGASVGYLRFTPKATWNPF
ncbi:MAG: DUF1134 domain-containing protein [Hyphomicrobiaceae bacterium]